MVLRDYQSEAVDFLLPRQRGFIVAPAGSGKTVIAAGAASRIAQPFDRICWLANTREQCEQARKACLSFTWPDPVVIDVQCVAARPDVQGAAIVVVDEAHHTPAPTWWTAISASESVLWGFSATPWSKDWERDGILKAVFGEEGFFTVARDRVVDDGSIVNGVVVVHDLDSPGEFDAEIESLTREEVQRRMRKHPYIPKDEHERRARWQFTSEAIRRNDRRNAKIVELASSSEGSVLVLVGTILHGEALQEKIPGSGLVHARIGKKRRAELIEDFRHGMLKVLIATSLADEGLDVPRASVLVLASGGRSAAKIEQRTGRVMRPHAEKVFGVVHDFADRGCGLGVSQFLSRRKTYRRLGYEIT